MLVILQKDVKGTGKKGQIVKVSDGFANNRLIPAGMAIPATDKNVRTAEKEAKIIAEKLAADKAAAQATAEKLESKPIVIKTKIGNGGKLFGSITSMDIANAIKEQLNKTIDKKKIVLAKPIKEIGETEVEVKLFQEVSAKIKVIIEEA